MHKKKELFISDSMIPYREQKVNTNFQKKACFSIIIYITHTNSSARHCFLNISSIHSTGHCLKPIIYQQQQSLLLLQLSPKIQITTIIAIIIQIILLLPERIPPFPLQQELQQSFIQIASYRFNPFSSHSRYFRRSRYRLL